MDMKSTLFPPSLELENSGAKLSTAFAPSIRQFSLSSSLQSPNPPLSTCSAFSCDDAGEVEGEASPIYREKTQEMIRESRDNSLKRNISVLKRSVEYLKKRSKKITKSLSKFSTSSKLCFALPSPQALVATRLASIRTILRPLPLIDTGTQVDPSAAHIPMGDSYEGSDKLSFSIIDGKKDLWPLLVHEEEHMEQSFEGEIGSTTGSLTTPGKRKEGGNYPVERKRKRAYTTNEVLTPVENGKSPVYYLKVNGVNGRYFDASGVELVLGKPVSQGIELKGKETTGGFRLFSSAQECMNSEIQPVSPRKGSRIGLMKVLASGPSLRYVPSSISQQEVVFTSITPQDVLPRIAANVLLPSPTSQKRGA